MIVTIRRVSSLRLWRYNTITGIWNYVREVEQSTAQEWLAIFQKAEPNKRFKISKNTPSK